MSFQVSMGGCWWQSGSPAPGGLVSGVVASDGAGSLFWWCWAMLLFVVAVPGPICGLACIFPVQTRPSGSQKRSLVTEALESFPASSVQDSVFCFRPISRFCLD